MKGTEETSSPEFYQTIEVGSDGTSIVCSNFRPSDAACLYGALLIERGKGSKVWRFGDIKQIEVMDGNIVIHLRSTASVASVCTWLEDYFTALAINRAATEENLQQYRSGQKPTRPPVFVPYPEI